MTSRTIRTSLLPVAALALCSSLALAQAPAPPAPPAADTPSATQPPAPVDRQPPSGPQMGRGMRSRSDMMGRPDGRMQGRGGPDGGMGGSFRIAPGGMWWKNPNVVQRLTLTPEQVKKMDSIFQQSRLQLIDLKANVEKQEVMLDPMLSANPLDTNKAMAQIDKVAQARADLEKANAKMLLSLRAVLTPDQWTKLNDRPFGRIGGRDEPGGRGVQGPSGPGGPAPSGGPMRGRGPGNGVSDLVAPVPEP